LASLLFAPLKLALERVTFVGTPGAAFAGAGKPTSEIASANTSLRGSKRIN